MMKLSAFADEISPDVREQAKVLKETGVSHVELRSVNKVNILDFTPALRSEVKGVFDGEGLGVIAIGSPIGKVKITDSWETHFDRFKIAVDMAEFFAAPFIRLFSYYPSGPGDSVHAHRDEVLRRMAAKVEYVKNRNVVLLHENEKGIFGDKGATCLDLVRTIASPKLRNAFDFANYVQEGEKPLNNWPLLKPYTVHFHIKDALLGSGKVVPAGQGDGDIARILKDAHQSGYSGFLSLEPHLSAAEQFFGFSGPALFTTAVKALKDLCAKEGIFQS